jgi:taurine dioxygenase
MKINLIGEEIGAEILGVDVNSMDDHIFNKIYQSWLNFNIIVVRDQDLSAPEYIAYSRRFGDVVVHPSRNTRFNDHPEITLLGVNKFDSDGKLNMSIYKRGGEDFHTDGSYERIPFKATQLYALAIPTIGGDTLFASTYASYNALPSKLKLRLEGLNGAYIYGGPNKITIDLLDEKDRNAKPVLHPLILTHPETHKKVLYFDPNKLLHIEGLVKSESDSLISELREYMIQPKASYRHKWRKGDVVIWDNRCSYHKAAADYPPDQDRIHWRVSIKDFDK